jgi:glucosamine-6-phosphate deaminase
MRVFQAKDYKDMSRKAANIISAQIIMKSNCVLGLATGSSPIGTYQQLIEWYKKGDLDFSEVRSVNLDEYKGLSRNNEQSYYYFMNQNLFRHVNINPNNTYIPDGTASDNLAECERYNRIIRSLGGVDLQLLGLGHNGHIGFNEPGQAFEKETHCVELTESTISANARLFENPEDVPRYAFTMGIKNIMQAKKIVVVVSGEDKANIVRKAFFGPVTPTVPASILQMHNDVVLIGDEAALSKV